MIMIIPIRMRMIVIKIRIMIMIMIMVMIEGWIGNRYLRKNIEIGFPQRFLIISFVDSKYDQNSFPMNPFIQ